MTNSQLVSRSLIVLALCAVLASSRTTEGQSLYLLTGPKETSQLAPISLFIARGSGTGLNLVRTVSRWDGEQEPCSVSVSPADRLAGILVGLGTEAVAFTISMDAPGGLQEARIGYGTPPGAHRGCLMGFLARSPDGRLLQVVKLGPVAPSLTGAPLGREPATSFSLLGVQIRPATDDPKTEQLPWSYEGRIETSGAGWGGEMGPPLFVSVKGDGSLAATSLGPAALPYSLEQGILGQVIHSPAPVYWLEVSNADWLSLGRTHFEESVPNGLGASFHDILDKRTGRWLTQRVPGSDSVLQNFGDWFAGLAIEGESTRESPGKARRDQLHHNAYEDSPVDQALRNNREYSPGVLFLANIRTQKTYTVKTNEGDSEVLLIDSDAVYYRVNDSIFRAPIGPENIGDPVKIATDPQIPDVHWAFLGLTVQAAAKKQ